MDDEETQRSFGDEGGSEVQRSGTEEQMMEQNEAMGKWRALLVNGDQVMAMFVGYLVVLLMNAR